MKNCSVIDDNTVVVWAVRALHTRTLQCVHMKNLVSNVHMKENVVREKIYAFALRMIACYKHLVDERREFVLSRQALRSGTSVGANVEEALGSQSNKEFYAKLSIAYREARETHSWLRLLRDSESLDRRISTSLLSDCDESSADNRIDEKDSREESLKTQLSGLLTDATQGLPSRIVGLRQWNRR